MDSPVLSRENLNHLKVLRPETDEEFELFDGALPQVIRDVCPWARVEMVPGAEHTLPLTIPERIDRALTEN